MEPQAKRPRIEEEIEMPSVHKMSSDDLEIRSILSDEYTNPIKTVTVYVGTIKDQKKISSLIFRLIMRLPMADLQHLKRVRKNQIILFKKSEELLNVPQAVNEIDDQLNKDVLNYLQSQGLDNETLSDICTNISLVEVPANPPKLRWQYDQANKLWPCKFHPIKYLEALYSNQNFKPDEADFHKKIILAVKFLTENNISDSIGICIDPRSNSVVAVSSGKSKVNPLMHCPMMLIDMVAKTQNGGVWDYPEDEFPSDTSDVSFAGITKRHYDLLRGNFKELKIGAQKIVDNNQKIENFESSDHNNLSKYGPYLLTGYDVYLIHEPCLMCAMALTHSRVRRVFYMKTTEKGALGSITKLHTVKDLNHHYEVFQIVERQKDSETMYS